VDIETQFEAAGLPGDLWWALRDGQQQSDGPFGLAG